MATHSSILAWRMSWTVGPGMLQLIGSQRVGRNLACTHRILTLHQTPLSTCPLSYPSFLLLFISPFLPLCFPPFLVPLPFSLPPFFTLTFLFNIPFFLFFLAVLVFLSLLFALFFTKERYSSLEDNLKPGVYSQFGHGEGIHYDIFKAQLHIQSVFGMFRLQADSRGIEFKVTQKLLERYQELYVNCLSGYLGPQSDIRREE